MPVEGKYTPKKESCDRKVSAVEKAQAGHSQNDKCLFKILGTLLFIFMGIFMIAQTIRSCLQNTVFYQFFFYFQNSYKVEGVGYINYVTPDYDWVAYVLRLFRNCCGVMWFGFIYLFLLKITFAVPLWFDQIAVEFHLNFFKGLTKSLLWEFYLSLFVKAFGLIVKLKAFLEAYKYARFALPNKSLSELSIALTLKYIT